MEQNVVGKIAAYAPPPALGGTPSYTWAAKWKWINTYDDSSRDGRRTSPAAVAASAKPANLAIVSFKFLLVSLIIVYISKFKVKQVRDIIVTRAIRFL